MMIIFGRGRSYRFHGLINHCHYPLPYIASVSVIWEMRKTLDYNKSTIITAEKKRKSFLKLYLIFQFPWCAMQDFAPTTYELIFSSHPSAQCFASFYFLYGKKRDSKQFPFDFLFLFFNDNKQQQHEVFAISFSLIIIFYDDLDAEEKLEMFYCEICFLLCCGFPLFPFFFFVWERKFFSWKILETNEKKGRNKSFIIIIRQ